MHDAENGKIYFGPVLFFPIPAGPEFIQKIITRKQAIHDTDKTVKTSYGLKLGG